MIKNLKMFADCVESLRTAEKAYEEDKTADNKNVVIDLQNKVDGWIKWIRQQRDKELVKNVPPFINLHPPIVKYKGVISYDQMNQLLVNHTQEEIDNFISLLIQDT